MLFCQLWASLDHLGPRLTLGYEDLTVSDSGSFYHMTSLVARRNFVYQHSLLFILAIHLSTIFKATLSL